MDWQKVAADECKVCARKVGATACPFGCGTRYCSLECLVADGQPHTFHCGPQKVSVPEAIFVLPRYKHNCTHGGPPPSAAMPLVMTLMEILNPPPVGTSAKSQLRGMVAFCQKKPKSARDDNVRKILIAMAVDAFADGNYGTSAYFLRAVRFMESFRVGGDAFLVAVQREGDGGESESAAAEEWYTHLRETTTRGGNCEQLCARIPCDCLTILTL